MLNKIAGSAKEKKSHVLGKIQSLRRDIEPQRKGLSDILVKLFDV